MFPKKQRVLTKEFVPAMKGRVFHIPTLSVCFSEENEKTFSVVASKKVSKKAVVRNRNKRRVRHIVKKIEKILPPGSYLIFVKKDISATKHSILEEQVKQLLSKVL